MSAQPRWRAALGAEHPAVAVGLVNLASLYQTLDRFDEAEKLFLQAVAIDEKAYGANHTEVAIDLNNLAWLYAQQGKYAKAEELILRALAIRETTYGSTHPEVAESLDDLASLMEEMGRIDAELQEDLDRLASAGIPVDVTFEQGLSVLR